MAREPLPERLARQQLDKPYPAIAIYRHWTLVSANRATESLLTGLSSELL